ncbi:aminoacyl-tRNA hydrolase [Candidatus Photodesmus blepharus]|nr:aminoacyl-tRNA hydrolase [Candidatus Photodesmus blepharus]
MNQFKLLVGLGNPGSKYDKTRHNIGSLVIKKLAYTHNITLKNRTKFFGLTECIIINNAKVHLLIPTTFMNSSGNAVMKLIKFYQIKTEEILIIHDELDFQLGTAKFKKGGGHGGHNGLRDIISKLDNKEFYRLRIGIGRPQHKNKVSDYVLAELPINEQQCLREILDQSVHSINILLKNGLSKAQNHLHTFRSETNY